MELSTERTAVVLEENQAAILEAWLDCQREDPRFQSDPIGGEELTRQSRALLSALSTAIGQTDRWTDVEAPEFAAVRKQLSEISVRRERLGAKPLATASSILSLKDAFFPFLQSAYAGDDEGLAEAITAVNQLVDTLALMTYQHLVERREQTITQQAQELMEISTPVVQVWEGVVAAPLIGVLDSERTQRFMERLLERIVETNSPVALVDITGVPAIDTQTAQHLIDTINAVKLLGSQVILTGVRPSIAQTLVHLGINLSGVRTRSSFAGGLRVAMDILELELASTKDAANRE